MALLPPMARTKPEIERRIHAALEEERAKRTPKGRIALSSAGACVRNLWAAMHGVPDGRPPDGRGLMIFDVGSALEAAASQWLKKAGYHVSDIDPGTGEQWRVEIHGAAGVIASGRLDGIIRWGRPSDHDYRLVEYKTAKAKRFAELVAAGSYRAWSPGYFDQVNAYMGASLTTIGVPPLRDCLVMVINKDTSEIWAEMVRFDADRYAEIESNIRIAVESTEILPRPKEAKSQYCVHCKWCSRNAWCWSAVAGVEFDD